MIHLRKPGHRLGRDVLDVYSFDASRFRMNRIKAPDGPLLHNHPWEFCWGIILHGGYTHEFMELDADGRPGPREFKTFGPGDVNFMTNRLYHRIHEVEPETYSLFFWGPDMEGSRNSLRYWTPDGPKLEAEVRQLL